jgi:hypothetical protein
LNPDEANNIEPEINNYFLNQAEEITGMEASQYYVTQIEQDNIADRELLDAAVELQKEALWNRMKLGDKLYVRKLIEENPNIADNSPKIQLWRPVVVRSQLKL